MVKITRTNINFEQNRENIHSGIIGGYNKEFYICGNNLNDTNEFKIEPGTFSYVLLPETIAPQEITTLTSDKVETLNMLCCDNIYAYENNIPLPYPNPDKDISAGISSTIEIIEENPHIGCIEQCNNTGFIEWFNKNTAYSVFDNIDEASKTCKEPTPIIQKKAENGCTDPTAMNYKDNFIGCVNDNGITVRNDISCCEYPTSKCVYNGQTNVCTTQGSYFGATPNLSTSILKGMLCNSGQTCCEFLCGGEYRGDYDENSKLGVCSNYNPDDVTLEQIGENGYGSLEAFQNAIMDGIMCNCFSTLPDLRLLNNHGQTSTELLYDTTEWPEKNVKYKDSEGYVYISNNIENHPPNTYVDFKTCGYPMNLNAFRQPTSKIIKSQSEMDSNAYNNFYGETPKEIMQYGNYFTLPNNFSENTKEFNNGLKAGHNVITINCANGKQIIYNVCIPHQTTPYENSMWKTEFFACEVPTLAKPLSEITSMDVDSAGMTEPTNLESSTPTTTPTGGSSYSSGGMSSDGGY